MTDQPTILQQPQFYANPDVNVFAATNYRNMFRRFGIKTDDRRRHMYVVGKTGMGKTTMLENMVLNDIYAGHGVGLIDPHGDFAEKIINFIPPRRINDVVYFNPADVDWPIGFNILETMNPDHKHLVASGLMAIFKKIWIDMWSSRMEYILNNTILALLDFPGTTLLGINRMLADAVYRKRIVRNVKDPVVKAFWLNEFASYNDRYQQEAVAPIQNKIGQFLSASVIRNIVAQVKSRINVREIMDNKKIFIMNLSKGRIGEDNSRLLGGMLITKLQLSAMERVDTPENDRSDFFLYVDEFQNFATESFANILSEARKYHLGLIMAHQYMEQLDEKVLAAVLGNVGTILTFRVGSTDAEVLAKEFVPTFIEADMINLAKFHVYLKLMIDGVASRPFSATTLPPIGSFTNSAEKVIRVSRERYAVERDKIEIKIARWSGMEIENESDLNETDDMEDEGEDSEENDKVDIDKEIKVSDSQAVTKPSLESTSRSRIPAKPFRPAMDRRVNDGKTYNRAAPPVRRQFFDNKQKVSKNSPMVKPTATSIVDTRQKGISLGTLLSPKRLDHVPKVHNTNNDQKTVPDLAKINKQGADLKNTSKFNLYKAQTIQNTNQENQSNLGFVSDKELVVSKPDDNKHDLLPGRVARLDQ